MNLLKTISIVLTALLLLTVGCSSEETKLEQGPTSDLGDTATPHSKSHIPF